MKEITLKFREVAVDGLPKETGSYFVIQSFPFSERANDLPYSAVHGLWNAWDCSTLEDAKKTAITEIAGPHSGEITHWIPREEFERTLREDAQDVQTLG